VNLAALYNITFLKALVNQLSSFKQIIQCAGKSCGCNHVVAYVFTQRIEKELGRTAFQLL
jgi:hypothetical protein